ncbi:Uu.00g022630.m01.CDS01 [Anthostomella pinea]|uniref:Uu.00g022630.m01.CDS01 n=1 Tax=Anthostomella pinea TaxID=933095 RepID=A0AAI8W0J2_9PEZI|nr:Uu.00g022630.m01.CDS01 [Anthostomella pinea]
MVDTIDSIVKGAPQPGQELKSPPTGTSPIGEDKPGDPLNHTPSSPSMIYLNMLILEASLRAQYLELRARRRKHTFFLSLLCVWLVGFGYALFFAPREDGRGVGGSVYWVVDMTEKVCFISGIVTGMLVWATGIWDRGIRWPRRWFGICNRGLRGFNCKLVVIKRSWLVEVVSTIVWFFTYGACSSKAGQYRFVEPSILREVDRELNLSHQEHPQLPFINTDEEKGGHEEDLAPGGDYVMLLLWAKPFSPSFRENWELFRSEYWERENERRALLRKKLRTRDKEVRKQQSGWFWWLPGRQRLDDRIRHASPQVDAEKSIHHHHRPSLAVKENRRTRSGSIRRGSTSAGSSRSPTPAVESEEGGMSRRGSTASNTSNKGRKKHLSSGSRSKRPGIDSRSLTPEFPSPLARESSLRPRSSSYRVYRFYRVIARPLLHANPHTRLPTCEGTAGFISVAKNCRFIQSTVHGIAESPVGETRLCFSVRSDRRILQQAYEEEGYFDPTPNMDAFADPYRRPMPTAPYSARPPSPPSILIPTPALLNANEPIKVVPNFTNTDPLALSPDDLAIITQNGQVQIAHDSAANWTYASRRTAQPILDFLYLGPSTVVRDRDWLRDNGITLLVAARDAQMAGLRLMVVDKVAEELGIQAEYVDVSGHPDLIRAFPTAVQKINDHMLRIYRDQATSAANVDVQDGQMVINKANFRRGKVLIFCETGNERSAGLVAAYLMSVFGLSLVEACQFIHFKRFCASLDESMKQLLRSYEDILVAKRTVHQYQILSKSVSAPTSSKRGFEETVEEDDSEMGGMNAASDADRFSERKPFTPFVDAQDQASR